MFSVELASFYPASAQNLEVAPTFEENLWNPPPLPDGCHVDLDCVEGASEEHATSGPIDGTWPQVLLSPMVL